MTNCTQQSDNSGCGGQQACKWDTSLSRPACVCDYTKSAGSDTACTLCNAAEFREPKTDHTVCACKPGYKGNASGPCTQCSDNEIAPNQGQTSCDTCTPNKENSNATKTACICASGYGVSGDGNSCETCPIGSVHKQVVASETTRIACTQCTGKQYANANTHECTNCPENEGAKFDHSGCVASADLCGENAVIIENECKCKDGYTLNTTKLTCEANSVNPSTASAVAIAAIVIALLAVVAAATTAAVVAVRARKARAAEAEALTAENM